LDFFDCATRRFISHPTGAAAMIEMIQPCAVHATEKTRFRAIPKGETVSTWVRTPAHLDPIRAR
jgi:hypothetical protein